MMTRKALAAKIGFGQLELLQGRAHRPVDDDDALLQESFEGMKGGRGHGSGEVCFVDPTRRRTSGRSSSNSEHINISGYGNIISILNHKRDKVQKERFKI